MKPFFFCFLPDEGYYQSGRFQFEIDVPEAYNMVVSGPVMTNGSSCVAACVFVWSVLVDSFLFHPVKINFCV